jgi:oxygen-independent coproporphyrinogen-3 oxidase
VKKSSIYIHVPFCDHKCIYCDFYSIIKHDNLDKYINTIKREIDYYSGIFSEGRIFDTIFFGGGTPSLLEPYYVNSILSHLQKKFCFDKDIEITLETNPGTVNKEKLKEFFNCGINRISIGIQSFDNEDLKFLTRIHDSSEAISTVENAYEAGFNNINVDLIFNLPGQTKEKWLHNLETAVTLPIHHISAYSLILERGTILNKMVLDGKVKIQDEDYDAELYELTIDFLEKNAFHQYEVSNFSKAGYQCRHNNAYWHYHDYISFGPSAHSFAGGRRWWNYSSLKMYIANINSSGKAEAGFELLSKEKMLEEYVMLGLRSDGLNIHRFVEKFGTEWISENSNYFRMLEQQGFLSRQNGIICLTKKGYSVCDEILEKML